MRGFKINEEYLTDRDHLFIKEMKETQGPYNSFYTSKKYIILEEDQNEDGTISKERQDKIILDERKLFAKWKLRQKQREIRIIQLNKEHELKIKIEDEMELLKKEKTQLFLYFRYHVQPTLDDYARVHWKPFWKFYYDDNTKHKKLLKQYHELDLVVKIDMGTYI